MAFNCVHNTPCRSKPHHTIPLPYQLTPCSVAVLRENIQLFPQWFFVYKSKADYWATCYCTVPNKLPYCTRLEKNENKTWQEAKNKQTSSTLLPENTLCKKTGYILARRKRLGGAERRTQRPHTCYHHSTHTQKKNYTDKHEICSSCFHSDRL